MAHSLRFVSPPPSGGGPIEGWLGAGAALRGPKWGEALSLRSAWPAARWGSVPIEGGVMAAHKAEIEAAPAP